MKKKNNFEAMKCLLDEKVLEDEEEVSEEMKLPTPHFCWTNIQMMKLYVTLPDV